jgi:1-pyrroline-5-carboxylate dehydrogenase
MTKITYTSTNVDLEVFHRDFDAALAGVRAAAGGEHPNVIGGEPVMGHGAPIVDTTPIDTRTVLGRFAAARPAEVDRAVAAARAAQPDWARTPWRRRLETLRRAAALIRERKFALAALMSLEVGRTDSRRWETRRSRPI